MKFNLLYLLLPAALYGCYWIIGDLQGQSVHSFFGTAETEPITLNFEHDIKIQDLRVKMGDQVKIGDTLAILYRSELDKTTIERLADINQVDVERKAKNDILNKQKDVILAQKIAKISELQAQIKVLQTEDSLKSSVKKSVYENVPYDNSLTIQKISALKDEIYQTNIQTQEQIAQIDTELRSSSTISTAKVSQIQQDLDFIRLEKGKLFIVSPIEGYIEQVFVSENILVPAYKDLFKIYPRKPNKIIGFIHESSDIPFQLGDSVQLESSVRLPIKYKGAIVGSNPKLVELPYRLRKFTELRAWGREVYIDLPDKNQFYIGEKIMISLNTLPPQ